MKKVFLILLVLVALLAIIWKVGSDYKNKVIGLPEKISQPAERPLDKYTIPALAAVKSRPSEIIIDKTLSIEDTFTAYSFYYFVEGKKVSGVLNVPASGGNYPVIVMFRGYVDKEDYSPGVGTQPAARIFAKNGFITLAPDFLGYGESDGASDSSIEDRFQTYVASTTLLASVANLNIALAKNNINAKAILKKVGIWGHSNGGQIALSVLEITGAPYPTVLWAPVSKPFPYSVLYYTDEFEDKGKLLRKAIADFEKDYDVDLYSLTNYLDMIKAPLQIHQGTADDKVPLSWSNQLTNELKKLNKQFDYYTYESADHNLRPDGWEKAVERSINFYEKNLGV